MAQISEYCKLDLSLLPCSPPPLPLTLEPHPDTSDVPPAREVLRASLVAQWLRIQLPMQGTQVRALVWEDPTCCRATKPVTHNY